MSLGIKSSAFLRVFTMGSWVHDKVHVKSLDFFEPCAKAAKVLSQQGLLATYLIPGCVGRGVRLGSENSSGGATGAGVWKSGNASRQNVHGKCFTANVHGKIFTANVHGK